MTDNDLISQLLTRVGELEATCSSLRETKDTFFRNAEAWEAKCNAAWAERDHAREAYTQWAELYGETQSKLGLAESNVQRANDERALTAETLKRREAECDYLRGVLIKAGIQFNTEERQHP